MNFYYQTLQGVINYSEEIIKCEDNSKEIKESAHELNKSIQPCIAELKQSATTLKSLVDNCFHDIRHARDVWNSKERIMSVPTAEIWEEIGDWSGFSVRISNLYNQSKLETLAVVKKSWLARVETLTRDFFKDYNNKLKKSLGLFDKDNFIKSLDFAIHLQLSDIKKTLSQSLLLIIQDCIQRLSVIQKYANQLDEVKKKKITNKINSISESLKRLLENDPHYISSVKNWINSLKNTPQGLAREGVLGISREQFITTYEEVNKKLEKIVINVFDELWKLINNAIQQAMLFYNDFLELQNRYQNETSEQRQAEKDWIENQSQELIQIRKEIEVILKP
jgi:ACT domain-containing protein